jgi:hypothetical protein
VDKGTDSDKFTTTTLKDGDVVTVILTSDLACASTPTATSNKVTMTSTSVDPSVSIAASTTTICDGSSVTFTATPTNGGTNPSYQWQVNGVDKGTDSDKFTTTTLNDGDVVTVILTSDLACASTSTATSNPITISSSSVDPDVNIVASTTTICSGTSVTFTATPTNGGANPSYQWQVNGVDKGTDSDKFTTTTLNDGDVVTVIMTSDLACASTPKATSNKVTMTSTSVDPSVSIAASTTTICDGSSVTFTATPTNGGTNPSYQWQVNGVDKGTDSDKFTTTTLNDGDVVTVIMTSDLACSSTPKATSNKVTMTSTSVDPSVSIAASTTTICNGTSVTFTATPTNGGANPSYQWKVNGQNVGTDSDTYTTSSLSDGDIVTVIMTSDLACVSTPNATSNKITMASSSVDPSVKIAASTTTVCNGTSVTFTATPTNGGANPSYQWKVNGQNVGTDSETYTTSSLSDGDIVTVIMTSDLACVSTPKATSNKITMASTSVDPSVKIAASTTTICSGTSVTFTATPTNGGANPSYQWKVNGQNVGTDSDTYTTSSLSDGDIVTVVMTSDLACASTPTATSNKITMASNAVTPDVVITSNTTSVCTGTMVNFTATGTNGGPGADYQWRVNGTKVGTNSNNFSSNTLNGGDVVTVVMTSSLACTTKPAATSNPIVLTTATVDPSVTISASSTTICTGTDVTFTATPVNGGSTPSYQWKVNGDNVGTNSNTFSSSTLKDGDVVTVRMTSSANCLSKPGDNSNPITMNITSVDPDVTIVASSTNICVGSDVTFTATPVNGGSNPKFQWKVNGVNAGSNSNTLQVQH